MQGIWGDSRSAPGDRSKFSYPPDMLPGAAKDKPVGPTEWLFSDRMVNAWVELDCCHERCHRTSKTQ